MCEECKQPICDIRCPNNTNESVEHCVHCDKELEQGDKIYFVNDVEIFCKDCINNMTKQEFILHFLNVEVI